MAKKQKIKNEDPSINFRLPPEIKKWVNNEAISKNITVSDYLRNHLEKFIDGSLYYDINKFDNYLPFHKSIEFLQLITFVFSKRKNSKCESTIQQLEQYIKTIKQMDIEELPKEIISEFDNVLIELIKVKNENKDLKNVSFDFCGDTFHTPDFNYDLLEDYLLNKVNPIKHYIV